MWAWPAAGGAAREIGFEFARTHPRATYSVSACACGAQSASQHYLFVSGRPLTVAILVELKIMRARLIVSTFFWVGAMLSQAEAQEARRLVVGFGAEVVRDSNVTGFSKAQAELVDLTPEDTTFTPHVSLDIASGVGRHAAFLKGTVGYSFFEKNDQLNRENIDLTGGLKSRIGACQPTLTGAYSRGRSQIDDPSLFRTVENILEVKRASLDVVCQREAGFGVTFGTSKEWGSNDFAALVESDYETASASAGLGYSRPSFGSFTVFGNYQTISYPNRILTSGYDLYAVGVTYDRRLGARLQGTATVAYTKVEQSEAFMSTAGSSSSESTAYDANISYRVSNRLRLTGAMERSVTPSVGVGRNYDRVTSYHLDGDYDLSPRINISLGAGEADRESGGVIPALGVALLNSKTKSAYLTVRYRQSDRLFFTAKVARDERVTNTPIYDYESVRFGVSADATF